MKDILSRLASVNALNIERAYKDCDQALGQLRAHAEHPEAVSDEELDALVARATEQAERILSFKGHKAWDGAYREMHEYLAKMDMERRRYDSARDHARAVSAYDRNEGEYLLKQIAAHESGQQIGDFDPSTADEEEKSA
jgi:hypothetical protein